VSCYHCAEPVTEPSPWQVEFDGQLRSLCCAGCEAVMQAIVDAQLGDYYRFRTEPARFGVLPSDLQSELDEYAVYDEPEISERLLQKIGDEDSSQKQELVDINLSIEGMRCGACVWVLERALAALPGVARVRVNFSSSRASVDFAPDRVKLSAILKRIAEVGYRAVPFDAQERELSLKRESRVYLQRLFIAGIATMQVMMYALPGYLSGTGEIDAEHEQLLRWASLILTTPVVLYCAYPFFKGTWRDLKNRRPGMDVPVSIGIVAAFAASVWATVTASGEIYFDSVSMFVFLLLGARYLEWSVRRRAMRAVDDIGAGTPETAQLLVDEVVQLVPAMRLQVDDLIVVDSGEHIPVDCVVHAGQSAVNNALLTGESVPVVVGPGDEVAGGGLLSGAPLRLRVLRPRISSTLSLIDQLVERGASEKPQTLRLADRIATVFVSLLLIFATLVWLSWLPIDNVKAATTAIAVLVVSCPCALSLATPAALAAATGALLQQRLLITRGHALETLAAVSDVVFDKTGTLTTGHPEVTQVQLAEGQSRQTVLQLASILETGSSHPYAKALHRAHQQEQPSHDTSVDQKADAIGRLAVIGWNARTIEHAPGHGVCAHVDEDVTLLLGSAAWCGLSPVQLSLLRDSGPEDCTGASEVFLSRRSQSGGTAVEVLARFLLKDTIRSEVGLLLAGLKEQGLRIHLISGDRQSAVKPVAVQLGITNCIAEATPDQKQTYVSELQAAGRTVLMLGDGINDAPVLASADVSMAVGDASALARTAADVISLRPGLDGLNMLLQKSRQTRRIMIQNLAWAASYNLCAIPLAALGFVPPWAAAIGMAASSLLVALNAQRLWIGSRKPVKPNSSLLRWGLWKRYSY